MTLAQLTALLRSTGYPVAFSHFDATEEPPTLPFITYMTGSSDNLSADDRTYRRVDVVTVELYTDKKDIVAESRIENLFDDNDLAYQYTQQWVDSEQMFQKIYEMRLM